MLIPILACLSNSMHKPIDATNITQADDNEPFNECKMDDYKIRLIIPLLTLMALGH